MRFERAICVKSKKLPTHVNKRETYGPDYVALRRCVAPRAPLPDRSLEETVAPDRPPVRLDTLDTDTPDGESIRSDVSHG